MSRLDFKVNREATGSRARAATFRTIHNEVQTPVFMPVGTNATVRGQRFEFLEQLDYPILLANTYHLMLRPGAEVFRAMGGIQRFMNWPKSVLTDSGGFQIFSLTKDRVMSEEGALFRSYVDNRPILLTPELSIETQKAIGSDIMMVLDQCVPSTAPRPEAEAAMHLTHRWAERSFAARGDSSQSLFAIVQGACYPDLRKQSAEFLTARPFDGFAIGGLAVGETKAEREDTTEFAVGLLPRDRPRYLMGVGTPIDILEAVHRGVDLFDCIIPNALGQQGVAFTWTGKRDLRRASYKLVEDRIDSDCQCPTCSKHSIAYLHHLITVKESLGSQAVALHNLYFYAKLMEEIRTSILNDTFLKFYEQMRMNFSNSDRVFPITVPKVRNGNAFIQGNYEVHETRQGIFSIKHRPSGEVMHSVNEPTAEAKALYIDQSRLVDKLKVTSDVPLVIWDVGLGAAINAMAVVTTYLDARKEGRACRPLTLISFENDLDSLRLGIRHRNLLKHLRHGAPQELLEKRIWQLEGLKWILLEGDFKATMRDAQTPHLIFFDPFSLNTDTDAWTLDCFHSIFEICKGNPTELFTYSSSTAVRALLLAAGFYVAKGVASGPRSETTVAFTPEVLRLEEGTFSHPVLNQEWLQRWERSHAKFPSSVEPGHCEQFEVNIRSHPQFS